MSPAPLLEIPDQPDGFTSFRAATSEAWSGAIASIFSRLIGAISQILTRPVRRRGISLWAGIH
jgi:hypothetical protein